MPLRRRRRGGGKGELPLVAAMPNCISFFPIYYLPETKHLRGALYGSSIGYSKYTVQLAVEIGTIFIYMRKAIYCQICYYNRIMLGIGTTICYLL